MINYIIEQNDTFPKQVGMCMGGWITGSKFRWYSSLSHRMVKGSLDHGVERSICWRTRMGLRWGLEEGLYEVKMRFRGATVGLRGIFMGFREAKIFFFFKGFKGATMGFRMG